VSEESIESALLSVDEQSSDSLVAVIEKLGEIFARFALVFLEFLKELKKDLQIAS